MIIMNYLVLVNRVITLKNNTGYWQGKTYLGIGPSAHGFDGDQRYWNVSNNASYLKQIAKEELPQTIEKLSVVDRYNESIMIGLRASWGVSLQAMEKRLGVALSPAFGKTSQTFCG